ncbi:hypothetical protein [Hydrogenophaga sp.]|uniref:hypothetical protein n=1 Tax=Hydrogenophaga sp. TaxID=1904254 RepID=UPI002731DB99|nr:hypothetical protein [Hydrogenophaga sp.]
MTERIAEDIAPAAVFVRRDLETEVCGRRGGVPAVQRECWSARPGVAHPGQPLALEAVLRHVLQLARACEPSAISSIDAAAGVRTAALLDDALEACLQLDAARLQLQNAITTQREVETVSEMLAARVEAGQATRGEQRKLEAGLNLSREAVTGALHGWSQTGRRFTKLTHLLPVQLECIVDTLGPIPAEEMDRLAEACLWTHADVHLSLRQRARAWTDRQTGSARHGRAKPEDFNVWVARIEQAREQAAADFACAREVYLQAILDHDREHASFVKSRSLRRIAETNFRLGARSATEFTDALLDESRRLQAVFLLQAGGLLAKHRLYALAGEFPVLADVAEPGARGVD